MRTVHSYSVEDKHGNKYLCNHEFNMKTNEHSIKLGATHSSPCVTIEYDASSNGFWISNAFYNTRCAYGGLQRNIGTKSMIYTALCITKAIYPKVKTFMLQDNSQVETQSGSFKLYEYYLLTRGTSWYQSFLPIVGDTNLQILYNILSRGVTQTPQEIATMYGIKKSLIENTYIKCAQNDRFTWLMFHNMLFNDYKHLRTNDILRKVLVYHTSDTFAGKLFGAKYTGSFDDIHCDGILGMEPIETKLFQQTGGSFSSQAIENQKMIFTWEDVL